MSDDIDCCYFDGIYIDDLLFEIDDLKEKIQALADALRLARTYVAAMNNNIAGAVGSDNTVIRPDLDKIDALLAHVVGGAV